MQKMRVKTLRKSLGLNQESFGEVLGVGKTAVSKWEHGVVEVPSYQVKLMSKEFNMNPDWFRTGVGEMFNKSDDIIMDLFRKVNFGDNEFHKNLFRAFAKFDESEWIALESIIDKINEETKKQTD
ncbi:helix-turn-helix domain-containing protein [Enterococcus sp. BWR-S5]|uniref:helix-turn-helix domain-containing protein n=1 Tax=Enterococcus sp. BWR-S5 TaxID=2787714 RepID=UPI0019216DDE|nr:helix-turn-helix domain-containing protein [Enterococcus sp. BWR-S5]MBL1224819.1 helix-turn-helix domain-containing protein [Enterococcus sp. BWR-S5]